MNHSGSSGSMECSLALILTQKIYNSTHKKASIGEIVTDDDTTMRSNIKYTGGKAKLPVHIPELRFLADPTHRIKVMVRNIFAKAVKSKNAQKIKTIDALRIKNTHRFTFIKIETETLKVSWRTPWLQWRTCLTTTASVTPNGVTVKL